jgi:hypothetical protein
MSKSSAQLPFCHAPQDVEKIRQRWVNEAERFIAEISQEVDDAEIYIKLLNMQGWSFTQQKMRPLTPPPQGEAYIRLFKGGHTVWGRYPLVVTQWTRGARELIKAFPNSKVGLYRPPKPMQQFPRPNTFDPRFHKLLGEGYQLQRLAHAISDNSWHEGERFTNFSKLITVQGRTILHLQHRIVCNGQGIVEDSRLHLEAAVRLNQHFEDRKQTIYAPASLLPWALMGSSLWRKRAPLTVSQSQSSGYREVILAPKVLEKLLRQRLPFVCTYRHFEPNAQVGSECLTLTFDPKADGMVEASPFDDLGRPRSTTPLILQGVLTAPFTIDPLCAQWSPQGLRPHLGTFFIRPGERSHAEILNEVKRDEDVQRRIGSALANKVDLQVENATLDAPDERGANGFSLRLTEAISAQHHLLSPGKYKLSGTVASTAEGPGILEDIEFSKEVVDTGTAVLPYARVRLYLHPA